MKPNRPLTILGGGTILRDTALFCGELSMSRAYEREKSTHVRDLAIKGIHR